VRRAKVSEEKARKEKKKWGKKKTLKKGTADQRNRGFEEGRGEGPKLTLKSED